MTIVETIQSDIKNWWLFILKGLVFIGAGVYVFCSPLAGYIGLSVMFSIVIIISGVSQIYFASVNSSMKGWGWSLISGILDMIIGIYLFSYPLITMVTLPIFLGFWLMFRSFYLMGIAFDLKSYGITSWTGLFIGSILLLIAALLVMYFPAAGAAGIIAVTGIALVVGGILNIMLALKFRDMKKITAPFVN
jgi:uncharacterized membrane protein HdeD (DUF308 family)